MVKIIAERFTVLDFEYQGVEKVITSSALKPTTI